MAFYIGVNVLVIHEGKVLLGKRLKQAGYGTWGLVGGHLEMGESFKGAAARELQEETGLVATAMEFVGLVNTPQPDKHYVQVNFVVTEWVGVPENKEPLICERLDWFPLESLPDNLFPPHKDFIPMFLEKRLMTDTNLEMVADTP